MSGPIFVAAYWPLWKAQGIRVYKYDSGVSTISYDYNTDSMVWANYTPDGKWVNSWFYQYRPTFGIAEWRDDYPGKRIVMSPPTGWGEWQAEGSVYTNRPQTVFLQCWPPQASTGFQAVSFEAVLPVYKTPYGNFTEVLQMRCQQTFGHTTSNLRLWMGKNGIGPIAIEFMSDGLNPTSLAIEKVVSISNPP
jgi:hypothetical protein